LPSCQEFSFGILFDFCGQVSRKDAKFIRRKVFVSELLYERLLKFVQKLNCVTQGTII
jgi:hypothetical protein